MATARVRINQRALNQLLRGGSGPVVRHITTLTRRTANQAKRNVKVDNGHLRGTIQPVVRVEPGRVVGRVGTPLLYGLYLHEGTGIYGPRGAPIRPIRRKYLRFETKAGRVVYAKSVKGVRGDKWLVRALRSSVPYPVRRG
jgi:hypothetical protein